MVFPLPNLSLLSSLPGAAAAAAKASNASAAAAPGPAGPGFGLPPLPSQLPAMPVSLLDTLVPGLSRVSAQLSGALGLDLTLALALCTLALGLTKSANLLGEQLWRWAEAFGTSEVLLESDDVQVIVVKWCLRRGTAAGARALIARKDDSVDPYGSPLDRALRAPAGGGGGGSSGADGSAAAGGGTGGNGGGRQSQVTFDPAPGSYYFWHRGRLFRLALDSAVSGRRYRYNRTRLSCVGRSPAPLRRLIVEAEAQHGSASASLTTIRRADGKSWQTVATRASRPLESVILAQADKERIVADIEGYLRPEMQQWYSERGIPYRRGYLLHGPPGTGKSSLAFALAGLFKLKIYCISLLEPTLTESGLNELFHKLPRRCMVLLEDIDHAGLVRRAPPVTGEAAAANSDAVPPDAAAPAGPAGGGAKDGDPPVPDASDVAAAVAAGANRGNISLSGLLNVIDGIASQEGRVLLLTTNHIEHLDAALIRPGRIDQQIRFTLATQAQLRELFVRMYQPVQRRPKDGGPAAEPGDAKRATEPRRPDAKAAEADKAAAKQAEADREREAKEAAFSARVAAAAEAFAAACPPETFSPAEIQGYLLTQKHDPERAVEGTAAWVAETMRMKKATTEE